MSVPRDTRAGALQQVMATFRTALLAQDVVAQRAILDGLAGVNDRLRTLASDLQAEIDALGPDAQFWQIERLARYNELLDQIDTEVQTFAQTLGSQLPVAQAAAAQIGSAAALAQAQAIAGTARIGARWNQLSAPALREIVASTQFGPLADLLGSFGVDAAAKARAVLIEGIGTGQNARVVGRALEAATGTTRQRAQVIARTEILRAGKSANLQSFAANSDIISGWQWHARKGPRTCSACLIMDGTEFPTSTTFFPGHPQCRCVAMPVLRDYPTPKEQTGREYLESLPEAEQRALLGNKKYEAWKSGELELDDMVAPRYSERWGTSYQEASLATAEANAAVRRAGGISGTPTPTATPAPATPAPQPLRSSAVQRGPNSPDWVGKYEYPTPDADLSPEMLDARYRIAAGEDPAQFDDLIRREIFARSGFDDAATRRYQAIDKEINDLYEQNSQRIRNNIELEEFCIKKPTSRKCSAKARRQAELEADALRDELNKKIAEALEFKGTFVQTQAPTPDVVLSALRDLRPDYGQSTEVLSLRAWDDAEAAALGATNQQEAIEIFQSTREFFPAKLWDELAIFTKEKNTKTAIVDRGFAAINGSVITSSGLATSYDSSISTAMHELWHFSDQLLNKKTSAEQWKFFANRIGLNETQVELYANSGEFAYLDDFFVGYAGKTYNINQYSNLIGWKLSVFDQGIPLTQKYIDILPTLMEIGTMGFQAIFMPINAPQRRYLNIVKFWSDTEYVNMMLRLLISI